MRITFIVNGYLDWPPVPPGTVITEEDKAAGLVKQHSDGTWHMRVRTPAHVVNDAGDLEHPHEVMLHEQRIVDRYAALAMLKRRATREAVIAELLQHSNTEHLDSDHIEWIEVHDDANPSEELVRAALHQRRDATAHEHYRRFHALKHDPKMAHTVDPKTNKLQVDVWQLPKDHAHDHAKIAEFVPKVCTDEQLEVLVVDYCKAPATPLETYLNVVFSSRGKRPAGGAQ